MRYISLTRGKFLRAVHPRFEEILRPVILFQISWMTSRFIRIRKRRAPVPPRPHHSRSHEFPTNEIRCFDTIRETRKLQGCSTGLTRVIWLYCFPITILHSSILRPRRALFETILRFSPIRRVRIDRNVSRRTSILGLVDRSKNVDSFSLSVSLVHSIRIVGENKIKRLKS